MGHDCTVNVQPRNYDLVITITTKNDCNIQESTHQHLMTIEQRVKHSQHSGTI